MIPKIQEKDGYKMFVTPNVKQDESPTDVFTGVQRSPDEYDTKTAKILGIVQMIIGIISFSLHIAILNNCRRDSNGFGVFCGILFFASGLMEFGLGLKKHGRYFVLTTMWLNIAATVNTYIIAIVQNQMSRSYNYGFYYYHGYSSYCFPSVIMNSLAEVLALTEMGVAIFAAYLCGRILRSMPPSKEHWTLIIRRNINSMCGCVCICYPSSSDYVNQILVNQDINQQINQLTNHHINQPEISYQPDDPKPIESSQPIRYRHKLAKNLGIAQMTIGAACFVLQIPVTILIKIKGNYSDDSYDAGTWAGMLFFVAGMLKFLSGYKEADKRFIIFTLISNIIAACLSFPVIAMAVMTTEPRYLSQFYYYNYTSGYYQKTIPNYLPDVGSNEFIVFVLLIIICCLGVAEFGISVASSFNCRKALRTLTSISDQLSYEQPTLKYERKGFTFLGIIQMIIGMMCFLLGMILLYYGCVVNTISCGIWSGIVLILSGLMALITGIENANKYLITTTMFMSIIATLAAVAVTITSSVTTLSGGAVYYDICHQIFDVILTGILTILVDIGGIFSLSCLIQCCRAYCCCKKPEGQLSTIA